MRIVVTGGYGFIGSSLIRLILKNKNNVILNVDKLTKVSSINSINDFKKNKNYIFKKIDIYNFKKLSFEIKKFKPNVIINAAAESHVDNSIKSPNAFIKSNIVGTYNLLEISRNLKNKKLVFVQVSTDEVFGSLRNKEKLFTEKNKFYPNSPYSASKASAESLVRAWNKTYELNTITTNCCNNFGPWQYPEKFIPKIIQSCIKKTIIPIYGDGSNLREWIYVDDHSKYIISLMKKGKFGETYNIGSGYEISNLLLVKKICSIFSSLTNNKYNYMDLIRFVDDRKAHDFRYALNFKKAKKIIGNIKFREFDYNLKKTVSWYIKNYKSNYDGKL